MYMNAWFQIDKFICIYIYTCLYIHTSTYLLDLDSPSALPQKQKKKHWGFPAPQQTQVRFDPGGGGGI